MNIKINFFTPNPLTLEERNGLSVENFDDLCSMDGSALTFNNPEGTEFTIRRKGTISFNTRLVNERVVGYFVLHDVEMKDADGKVVEVYEEDDLYAIKDLSSDIKFTLPDATDELIASGEGIRHFEGGGRAIDYKYIDAPLSLVIHSLEVAEDFDNDCHILAQ